MPSTSKCKAYPRPHEVPERENGASIHLFCVFSWEFEESEEDRVNSIPYQLQRLFVLLQTSKKRAIETTDVTRSFGWDSSEGKPLSAMLYAPPSHRRSCLALLTTSFCLRSQVFQHYHFPSFTYAVYLFCPLFEQNLVPQY